MVTTATMLRSLLLVLLPLLSSSFVLSHCNNRAFRVGLSTSTTIRYTPKDDDKQEDSTAMLDDLSWRAAKIRLEEANTQQFLKRKPVKLPYLVARQWVQSNLGADTKEEFHDLVANGNMRSPYLPKNPKVYYTGTGEWVSWEHFLTGYFEERKSGLSPPTGKFD
jgi:hypothetical protein